MRDKVFKGILGYPITPFQRSTGAVDLSRLRSHIDRFLESGVHAMAPLGSVAENVYLTDREWIDIVQTSIKHINGMKPVVIGVTTMTTEVACERAKIAQDAGADAIMILPLSYWPLAEEEVERHILAVAGAVNVPIMLYNNPATSGTDMSPEFMVRLVNEVQNITMIKESTGDIQRMYRIMQLSDGQIPIFIGSNIIALDAFAAGAVGWSSSAATLAPEWTIALYEATQAGDLNQARRLFYQQLPLLQFIVKWGLPRTIKAGLAMLGHEVGVPRPPILPLGREQCVELQEILDVLKRHGSPR